MGLRGSDLVLDRLSPCAVHAFDLAREEARLLGHPYVGTDHLLIGLAREEHGAACRVLATLDLTPDFLRERIVFIGGRGEGTPDAAEPAFSPPLERVMETATKEAERRQQAQ